MGEVYRARDTRLNRSVAIKVLPASFATNPDRLRRFEQEARAVAALNHPNILALHDIGTHEGTSYLVSEFLEGSTQFEGVLIATGWTPVPSGYHDHSLVFDAAVTYG
jgi:serine/threonine protein kinase